MRRPRLFWRIYATYLVVVIACVAAIGVFAYSAARDFYLDEVARNLEARAVLARTELMPLAIDGRSAELQQAVEELASVSDTRFTVIAGAMSGVEPGTVIAESELAPEDLANHADRPEFRTAMAGQTGQAVRLSTTLGKQEMYVAVPAEQDGQVVAAVRAAMPLATVNDALPALSWRIAVAAVLVAAVAALAGFLVSSRISRQMRALRAGADRFAAGDLSHEVAVPRTEEFAAVAEGLNSMAEQLDAEIRTLTRERNEREAVLSSMIEGVIAVDMQERVITINEAAAELLGADRLAAVGRSVQEIARNRELQQVVAESLAGGTAVEREVTLRSGFAERVLQANGTLLRSEDDGSPVGAVVVLNDVTRLKRLEAVRRDFVANVSHELKTPVTSIKGFAETLQEGAADDPAVRERFLAIIASQAERLTAIISDLLALSALEAGEEGGTPLELGDVCVVVESAVAVCGLEARTKEIELIVTCAEPAVVLMNAALVEQAVVNLIDNAVKYSPQGSAVRVEVIESPDEVVVLVRDEGPGIARRHLPRLFERFYRVDSARSRDLGGTGLGLAIVKHVAQVHGGSVSVSSEVARGSVFGLHLPRRSSPATLDEHPPRIAKETPPAVSVDDHDSSAASAREPA